MIYSRSAEYAIRSFVYLARIPDGKFAMARQIAEDEKIPAHFLAKILQELTTLDPNTGGGNILGLDDPELFKYPVAYMCEPGFWTLNATRPTSWAWIT